MSQVTVDTGDVLYVGDNLRVVREIEARGHAVEHLCHASEFDDRARSGWYRLIVIDLPGTLGIAAAYRARQECPGARVLFSSGRVVATIEPGSGPQLLPHGTSVRVGALRMLAQLPSG